MTQIHQSVASLRVWGDALQPEEITLLLGASPSESYIKGQEWEEKITRKIWKKKCGLWLLEADSYEPANIDEQVCSILGKLTGDLKVWAKIREKFEIDLFCGFFMKESDEGISISPNTLMALGERGIEWAINIYAPDVEA